jgi:hypothetical protein
MTVYLLLYTTSLCVLSALVASFCAVFKCSKMCGAVHDRCDDSMISVAMCCFF